MRNKLIKKLSYVLLKKNNKKKIIKITLHQKFILK